MIFLLAILLLLASPARAAAQARNNTEYCRSIYGSSYSLTESCIQREYLAYQRLNSRRLMVDGQIWSYCVGIYESSWTLMESCVAREEEAKKRMLWGR